MNADSMQGYAPYAAAAAVAVLALVLFLVVRRRRRAAAAQARLQQEYAAAVDSYRTQVEGLLLRREELLSSIAAIASGDVQESLRDRDIDTDDPLMRLKLDAILAGDDQRLRNTSLHSLRRGVSDIEMLIPEPPEVPEPVARLSRGTRRRAEAWCQERAADLEMLRRLARPAPATTARIPAQATGPREITEVRQSDPSNAG